MRALGAMTKGDLSWVAAKNLCLVSAMASGPPAVSRACAGPADIITLKKCAALSKVMLCTGCSSTTT